MEYFKDVPGYEGFYQVSNRGRVLSVRRQKFMSLVPSTDGYRKVIFRVNKKQKCFLVHRLVLSAFCSAQPDLTVNHRNFIRDDNNLANLEYVTHSDNVRYSRRNGRYEKRKAFCDDRFSPDQINFIRNSKLKDSELAKQFATKKSFINKIRRHVAYTWLS